MDEELPPDEDWSEDGELDEEELDKPNPESDEGMYGKHECSAEWLDAGRRVRQARLSLTPDGELIFEKIELVK